MKKILLFEVIILLSPYFLVLCEESNLIETSTETSSQKERTLYAARMASYMDTNANPCEDFYQYACGNFFKVNKESKASGRFGSLFLLHDNLQEKIHELLTESIDFTKPNPNVTDKARIFYQSCIQADLFPYKKSETYLKLIDELGGWPVLNQHWKEDMFDWINITTILRNYRVGTLIGEISNELNFSEINILKFGLLPLGKNLFRPYSKLFQKNKEIAKYIMTMYGVSRNVIKKAYEGIIKFGREFEELRHKSKLRGAKWEDVTLQQLVEYMPEINWTKYYNEIYKDRNHKNLTIRIWHKNVIKQLPSLFRGKNLRNAANYFILRLLFHLHGELSFSQDQRSFCINKAQYFLNAVINAMFIKSKYHNNSITDEILAMASYIKKAFSDSLISAKWLDKMSMKGSITNLNRISIEIDDSELTLDLDELDKKYMNFDIKFKYKFRQNILKGMQFLANYNPFVEGMYSVEVNAYYSPRSNKLIIPGGIYRKPFYYPELPKSFNFGAIGTVLAHEFTHSMDSSQITKDWWNQLSTNEFKKRAKCFIKQYSNYRVDEINWRLQSNQTIYDDIADNGGIRHSFYGYKKWLKGNEDNIDMRKQSLPGLNMSDTQLYFLSFAQAWCESVKGFQAHKRLVKDVHSPGKWRIIGSLSNFDEFSKAFSCKPGSRMNPQKKCVLW